MTEKIILFKERFNVRIIFLCFFKDNVKFVKKNYYEYSLMRKKLNNLYVIQPEFETFHKFCCKITPKTFLTGSKPFLKAYNYVVENPQVLEAKDYKYVFILYPDSQKCKKLVEIIRKKFVVIDFSFENFDSVMKEFFTNKLNIKCLRSKNNKKINNKINNNSNNNNNDVIYVSNIIESQKFWKLLEEVRVFFGKIPNKNIFSYFLSYFKDPDVYFYFEEVRNISDMMETENKDEEYTENLKDEGKKIGYLIEKALSGEEENEYSGVAVILKEILGNVKETEKHVRDHPIYGKIDVLFDSAILEIKNVGEIQKKDFIQPLIYRELLLDGDGISIFVFNVKSGILYRVVEENTSELRKRLRDVLKRFVRE